MNIPNIDIKKTGQAAGILLAGLLLGWLLFGGSSTQQDREMTQHLEEAHTDEEGNIVYTCSMHPGVRQNEPGNCPICGMELIPVSDSKSGSTGEDAYTLTMTPASMKLAQIQTAPVTTGKAIMQIRLPGKVVVDERRISSVTAHFPGRIKELYVDFTGDRVRKGEKLASVYSPQLITAQRELMEARKYRENNPALYRATRRKLELWELPEEEIRAIEESGEIREEVNIVSPVDGYVLKRNISRQDHVMEGTIMYQIANLERLWVEFDAYESDLIGLKI
ncbi:MAG: efflux RND transporter periplasmic adaptor subunit, partial [Balneolaceae bacterium]|nr:efflux RND transporter periplasmic adaptor subunit [Balneolaceae bacterium]